MKVTDYRAVEENSVPESEGALGVTVRWLISEEDGAQNFAMRLFVVQSGGHTPLHTHSWEHEVFIIAGRGLLIVEGERFPLEAGMAAFVEPDEEHQFKNVGDGELKLLCVVPIRQP